MISDKMGRPKKTLQGKEKEGAFVYGMIRFLLSPLFSFSLPEVLKAKGFTDEESQNPGLQKRIQRGSECPEICQTVSKAVLATAVCITRHTTIPTAVLTESNTEGGSVSSLSDKGMPNQKKERKLQHQPLGQRSFV